MQLSDRQHAEQLNDKIADLRRAIDEVRHHARAIGFDLNEHLLLAADYEASGAEDRLHDDLQGGAYDE